jgi:hypothetical protein
MAPTLTQDQCASLVGPQNIPIAAIPALPNVCVNNIGLYLTNAQLAAFTTNQISSLSFDWLRAAGQARQLVLLPKASSDAVFRILSLGKLTDNQIALVTPGQLAGLTDNQFGLLRSSYYKAMTQPQMDTLRPGQISVALDKWTDQQMNNLTPDQIRGIPVSQTNELTSYFTAWNEYQIYALTSGQLAAVPQVFGYQWFGGVLAKMSIWQLDSLSDAAIIQLAKSPDRIKLVPLARIATLNDQTIIQIAKANTLQNLPDSQLAVLQVSALRQLKSLNLLGGLSQQQLAKLPTTDFTQTAIQDATCKTAGVDLGNLFAMYTTQDTMPAQNSGRSSFNNRVRVASNGIFPLPYTATYVTFDRDVMPSNINFYGVRSTIFAVTEGGRYTVTCRTSAYGN